MPSVAQIKPRRFRGAMPQMVLVAEIFNKSNVKMNSTSDVYCACGVDMSC